MDGPTFINRVSGYLDPIAPIMTFAIKKQMTDGITNTFVDQAYQAAMDAGAQGGKLLGAGGGGFLMFLAQTECHDSIRRALRPMRETPFRFAKQGSSIIFVH